MALPATENFTGDNGTDLVTHGGGNWVYNVGAFEIYDNTGQTTSATNALVAWVADSFNDNQYSYFDIVVSGSTNKWIGPSVRNAGSGVFTGYTYYGSSISKYLDKWVAASQTTLNSYLSGGFSGNSSAKLEAEGTTLTPIVDGSTDTDIGAQTDSGISSGSAGIYGYNTSTNARFDNWEGGNLGVIDLEPSGADNVTVGEAAAVGPLLLEVDVDV